jgi:NADH dehydrogenase
MSAEHIIAVFGGTGFLGRRIVRRLRVNGFTVRIAARHVRHSGDLFGQYDPRLQPIEADIHDELSIDRALVSAYGAVNAVSLYVEHGHETFQSVHVEAAQRLAARARRAGLQRLVHISGIGSDASSPSLYIRKRGEGETAVREAFADVVVVRPAVMFGPDDAFLTTIIRLLRRLPVYPMFADGHTRLQPACVEDVAAAVAAVLQRPVPVQATFECAGPRVYTYRELLRLVAREAGGTPLLLPVPFAAWHVLAWCAERLPNPPITRNQVELMRIDTVQSPAMPGFADLGVAPHSVEGVLATMVKAG